jgi:hypothetical protein
MQSRSLSADGKRVSALRRVPPLDAPQYRAVLASEGDVCAFELPRGAFPIRVESPTGRIMTIAPGDTFLVTPGYRESTRWVSGGIPAGGLVPGDHYWVLADCGIVGELLDDPSSETGQLGPVRYLGAVCGEDGETLNIRQFAVSGLPAVDRNSPVFLLLGTSGDVGKTTAGIAVLQALRMKGHTTVVALKATGTASYEEIARYQDFGAAQAFDCIDFGLPTTYPSGRDGIGEVFARALDFCLSLPADALVVECGGDLFGANVPEFLTCLKTRRSDLKITLAAADALGAFGAKQTLARIGLAISLITGPCTDTPSMRERTEALCGIPAINLLRGPDRDTQPYLSGNAATV